MTKGHLVLQILNWQRCKYLIFVCNMAQHTFTNCVQSWHSVKKGSAQGHTNLHLRKKSSCHKVNGLQVCCLWWRSVLFMSKKVYQLMTLWSRTDTISLAIRDFFQVSAFLLRKAMVVLFFVCFHVVVLTSSYAAVNIVEFFTFCVHRSNTIHRKYILYRYITQQCLFVFFPNIQIQ